MNELITRINEVNKVFPGAVLIITTDRKEIIDQLKSAGIHGRWRKKERYEQRER